MNSKTKILFIAIMLVAAVFLSGCTDSNAADESSSGSEKVTEKTTTVTETVNDPDDKKLSIREDIESNETTVDPSLNTTTNSTSTPTSYSSSGGSSSKSSGSSSSKSDDPSSGSEDADTITVTDDIGRTITIPYPCERNVFLVENAMNSMYAVGGADEIVGIGAVWQEDTKAPFFRAIDPNYDSKRLSEGTAQPGTETIATVDPQLVLLWAADWESEDIKSIEESINVPVYGVYIDSLDDLQKQMKTFSKIIDKEEEGDRVLDIMDENMEQVTDITDKLSDEEKPTVYWMWGDVYGTAGKISTANDLIGRAGGVNVLNEWDNSSKSLEHPVLNLETILDLNPEVIYMWYNTDLNPSDIISGNTVNGIDFSVWSEIDAVKNGRVYEISDPFVYDFHSPRLPLAMMHIAKDLHPDKFAEIDLAEETDQYYVDIYGVHYPGFELADDSGSNETDTITITDSANRTVDVPYPVESIVVLWDNPPEELRSLGAIDRIVGIDTATKEKVDKGFFPELEDVPVIGSYDEPDYEKIAELNPDVVIMLSSYAPLPDEVQEKLEPFGITVVALDFYMVEEWEREVTTLGKMLDKEEEAEEYIAFFQEYWDMLDERSATISEEEKKTVYFEGAKTYQTYGGADYGSGIPGMIRAAGGLDLFPRERSMHSRSILKRLLPEIR
ncbi:ABC transporter substrate-binding protein, partial [Methanomethylovorans sp.]|uniref:ABC transporter substrate-binding protein n=1 Tax=Methanomethylovorans sp. TaxID=2758717 RepID=UPI00351CA949